MTGDNDGQPLGDFPNVRQRIARGIGAADAEPVHTLNLSGLEREKHMGKARFDDRLLIGHGTTLE
jgi:hypothetical protein